LLSEKLNSSLIRRCVMTKREVLHLINLVDKYEEAYPTIFLHLNISEWTKVRNMNIPRLTKVVTAQGYDLHLDGKSALVIFRRDV
jgi:hypothetical protein